MSIMVMSRVWDTAEVKGSHLLVLLALADWANDRGECDPSYGQLARRARVDRRRAIRIVKDLAAAGDLEVESGTGYVFAPGKVSNTVILRRYATSGTGATSRVAPAPLALVAPVPPTTVSRYGQQQRSAKSSGADAPLRDGSRWQPVQDEIARSLGATTATTKTGRPLAWVGQLTRQVGDAAGGDPDRACEVWAAFLAALSPDERERFLTPKSAGTRFGRWALNGGGQTIAAIVGTGDAPAGWTFAGPDGRPRLKSPAVLIAEGKLPADCDPLDPATWPPEYAAARKAVRGRQG